MKLVSNIILYPAYGSYTLGYQDPQLSRLLAQLARNVLVCMHSEHDMAANC